MQETFYFRKSAGWPFAMDVVINSDTHRINFLRAMERKRFTQVTEETYLKETRIRLLYASMFAKNH